MFNQAFYRKFQVLPIVGLAAALSACSSTREYSYVPEYETAVDSVQGTTPIQADNDDEIWEKFGNMQAVFNDLKDPNLESHIRNAYAEELYFNDTFHTFDNRDQLSEYLLATADRVKSTTTEFEEVGISGSSYFLRWKMHIEVEVSGETIVTDSIGVSQIRFDESGKVVFHQDFWDNTEGFFRHLPVVGYVLDKTFERL